MEDDLQIIKVEYISNYLLDPTQFLKWSFYDHTIFCKSFKHLAKLDDGLDESPTVMVGEGGKNW